MSRIVQEEKISLVVQPVGMGSEFTIVQVRNEHSQENNFLVEDW